MEQAAAGGDEGRVAPRRVVPARRLHRHQPGAAGRAHRRLLQPPRHLRAVHQRRQGRDQMDAAVVPFLCRQRGSPSASCSGVQPRQFHADPGDAEDRGAVVADQPAREAHQNRREGRQPRPLCDIPDGRGRGVASDVRGYPDADRPAAGAARAGMTADGVSCEMPRGQRCALITEKRRLLGTRTGIPPVWLRTQVVATEFRCSGISKSGRSGPTGRESGECRMINKRRRDPSPESQPFQNYKWTHTIPQIPTATRLDNLDLLRGIAAFLVLTGHLRAYIFQSYGEVTHTGLLVKVFYLVTGLGHHAVIIFFALSGFLVGGKAFADIFSHRFSWSRYLLRRLTRLWIVIVPALLLTLLLDNIGLWLTAGIGYDGQYYQLYSSGPHNSADVDHSLLTFFG